MVPSQPGKQPDRANDMETTRPVHAMPFCVQELSITNMPWIGSNGQNATALSQPGTPHLWVLWIRLWVLSFVRSTQPA